MTLLLLFQPARVAEEEVIVVVSDVFVPRTLVKVIAGPMGLGDQPPQSIKWN